MTVQRQLIFDIIQESDEHLTADQIYMLAKARMPSIAVGTVYRNLGAMAMAGDILRISVPNAPDHYDKTTKQHDHLVCRMCGKLLDVELGNLCALFAKQTPMRIEAYELTLYGTCEDCLVNGSK